MSPPATPRRFAPPPSDIGGACHPRFRGARHAGPLAATALVVLVTMGCGAGPDAAAQAASETAPVDDPDAAAAKRAETHRTQLGVALQKAQPAFALADPVAAHQVLGEPLAVPPLLTAERLELTTAFKAAEREVTDIDGAVLSAQEDVALRVLRFGVDRIRDALERAPIERTDATRIPAELDRLLEEIECSFDDGEGPSTTTFVGLVQAMAAISREADTLLTAASPANLRAGAEDWRSLAKRLRALPKRVGQPLDEGGALEAAAAAFEARADDWSRDADALAGSPALDWSTPPPLIGEAATETLPRLALPDVVAKETFTRWLLVEEGIGETPDQLVELAKANHARLGAMRDAIPDPPDAKAPRDPVDVARCERVTAPLWKAAQSGGLIAEDRQPNCAALARHLEGQVMEDATLVFHVVDELVTKPSRRTQRKTHASAVGLVSGRIATASQVHLRRIMLFSAADLPGPARRAIELAQQDLCGAVATLAEHGKLTRETDVGTWLTNTCTQRTRDEWRALARARPRQQLGALGFILLGREPHLAAALDHYAWAPLGFVVQLGNPEEARKPTWTNDPAGSPPLEVKIEEL